MKWMWFKCNLLQGHTICYRAMQSMQSATGSGNLLHGHEICDRNNIYAMYFKVLIFEGNSCWNCFLRDGNSKRKYNLGLSWEYKDFRRMEKSGGKVLRNKWINEIKQNLEIDHRKTFLAKVLRKYKFPHNTAWFQEDGE